MECNKDEAVRAKEIAERKTSEKNFVDAKKFALKAQNLFPDLEGLSQLLTTLDVYISAENRVSGEVDWYGILSVNPWADDETIKKQYRKLALMLHPDKNKSQGADGAFKLVSQAWGLLSDKAKRLEYNQRRNSRGYQQKVPIPGGVPSVPPGANGYQGFTNRVSSNKRNQNNNSRVSPSPSHQKSNTFWTICNRCKTHYEYLRIYQNHTLLCPNCHEAFCALEKDPPPNVFKSSHLHFHQQHENSGHRTSNNNPYNSGSGGSRTTSFGSTVASSSTVGQAASVVHQANEKVKRCREEGIWESHAYQKMNNSSLEVDGLIKKRRTDDNNTMRGYGGDNVNQMAYCLRELPFFETRKMLMVKARTEIFNRLKEWSSVTKVDTVDKAKEKATANGLARRLNKNSESAKGALASSAMNVPDPDFHNFDLERNEKSFGEDQVWAAYDADDGMPRYYARIQKVICLKPFRMRISWLNSRTNSELGPLEWVGSGFLKTCGEFRTGRHETSNRLNSFSHKVNWIKGPRGVVCIFPKKGDIWALYKNWSPDWNEQTPKEVIHKYDMVEVLDDYNEEQGVSVTPLLKVAGFRTVFHKHMDPNEIKRIPRQEMFRFSHQVPNYLLTGEEAPNAPKGCRELDPAATPLELLQVITEAYDAPAVENGLQQVQKELDPAENEPCDVRNIGRPDDGAY